MGGARQDRRPPPDSGCSPGHDTTFGARADRSFDRGGFDAGLGTLPAPRPNGLPDGAPRAVALRLDGIEGPFGLRAEGLAAIAGIAALAALAIFAAAIPGRAATPAAPPPIESPAGPPEAAALAAATLSGAGVLSPTAATAHAAVAGDGIAAGPATAAARPQDTATPAPDAAAAPRRLANAFPPAAQAAPGGAWPATPRAAARGPFPPIRLAADRHSARRNGKPAPWTISDLGRVRLEEHCIEAATLALRETAQVHGGDLLRRAGWTVELMGLARVHDAAIACAHGNGGSTRGTLILHSADRLEEAERLVREIDHVFTRHARRIHQRWLQDLDG